MSLCRESSPPTPTTGPSFEDAVRKTFRTCAKVALESLETKGLLVCRGPSTEAARITLGLGVLLCSAALQTTTNPPSISLPPASPGECIIELSDDNCPSSLRDFIHMWSQTVPAIRRLSPGQLNTVRRLLCGLAPLPDLRDPHMEGVASALDAVASALSTWCTRRDPVVSSQALVRVRSPAPLLHPSAVSEDHPDSMPRKRRQPNTLPTKGRKGRSRKDPILHQPSSVNGGSHQLQLPTQTPTGFEQEMRGRPQIKWGPITYSNRSTRVLPPLPQGKRPTIWAASSLSWDMGKTISFSRELRLQYCSSMGRVANWTNGREERPYACQCA
ncbi:hypothetical protein V8D89_014109 [Ganoderma adspersum]